jgi:hypothetical protein
MLGPRGRSPEGRGEILLFFDADLSTPLSAKIDRVLAPIRDMLVRCRIWFTRGLESLLSRYSPVNWCELVGQGWKLISQFIFTGLRFKDAQCGFKAFSIARRHERSFPGNRSTASGLSPEILFIAKRQGWRMLETGRPLEPRRNGSSEEFTLLQLR